jgi:hypothetical protein
MNYYKIIYFSSFFIGFVGLILLIVGFIYVPSDLPKQTISLSQDEFNKTLNNYRINSLGFKLIISGASIIIFSIGIMLIFRSLIDENESVPKSILKNKITLLETTQNNQTSDLEINEKKAKLIKLWTGKTPEEIAIIRKDFLGAKKYS